jgi:exopolysaccharide biosynthesis polyprenyl glycosylphosphotransferase
MLKQHAKDLSRIFRFLDFLIILSSLYLAYWIRFEPIGTDIFVVPIHFKMFFLAYLIVWLYLSNRFQLYASKRVITFTYEAWEICKTTALCLAIATIPAFFIREYPLSRLFLVYLWPFQTGILLLFRLGLRETLKYIRRRGYNYRQILIVGRNGRAAKIAEKIKETPYFGLRILGFIDAPNGNHTYDRIHDFNLIGSLEDLERILRDQIVDEVFITLPFKSFYSEIENIIRICEEIGVEAKIPIDLFTVNFAKETLSRYGDMQVLDFYTSPKMNWQLLTKRLIDMIVSSFSLILLSPLFAIVSILIKITSNGPIFFKQQRVGYNGRIFTCLKFRTMVDNAETLKKQLMSLNEVDGPVFKIKDDPRITKVGRILRKISIDELPQLINVLKGDMSLVGPRPPVPSEVTQYQLNHRRRLSMRPGITCTWQVNGRNSIPFEKWMELDKQYIDDWSLWLDFKILAKTIPTVLRGSGA